ncbi:MAG: UDP-N-acetylglucosamine 1-carboxyvinyltransferase, partial [Lentisphaeria bacterium]|nr:UDP-N-acetylglucosamine 1-carboxyvinyltransferase [Lentisphaeria bacterium]
MKSLIIEGPSKISGTIVPGGNKNAALPIVAACLLTEEEVVIHNMPEIVDVQVMLDLAASIGVKVERNGKTVKIHAKTVNSATLPAKMCARVRGSILFAGAVTYRCGEAHIGLPGGDFIGRRRLDSHYYGLRKLGITCDIREGMANFSIAKKLRGADMFLDEASVTATEQILIAASVAPGKTIIRNAAGEPHIQQLAELLNKMGAKIEGIGTNELKVQGAEKLHGAEYTIDSDHVEVASFLSLAAATKGGLDFEG